MVAIIRSVQTGTELECREKPNLSIKNRRLRRPPQRQRTVYSRQKPQQQQRNAIRVVRRMRRAALLRPYCIRPSVVYHRLSGRGCDVLPLNYGIVVVRLRRVHETWRVHGIELMLEIKTTVCRRRVTPRLLRDIGSLTCPSAD